MCPQNLPLLEKLHLQAGGSDSDSIQPDDTVEGISSAGRLVEGALPEEREEGGRPLVSREEGGRPLVGREEGGRSLVGRVGVTSSREDLSQQLPPGKSSQLEPRKRLEMRWRNLHLYLYLHLQVALAHNCHNIEESLTVHILQPRLLIRKLFQFSSVDMCKKDP